MVADKVHLNSVFNEIKKMRIRINYFHPFHTANFCCKLLQKREINVKYVSIKIYAL